MERERAFLFQHLQLNFPPYPFIHISKFASTLPNFRKTNDVVVRDDRFFSRRPPFVLALLLLILLLIPRRSKSSSSPSSSKRHHHATSSEPSCSRQSVVVVFGRRRTRRRRRTKRRTRRSFFRERVRRATETIEPRLRRGLDFHLENESKRPGVFGETRHRTTGEKR